MAETLYYHGYTTASNFQPKKEDLFMFVDPERRAYAGGLTDSEDYAYWHASNMSEIKSRRGKPMVAVYHLSDTEIEKIGLIPGFEDRNASSFVTVYKALIETVPEKYLLYTFHTSKEEAVRIFPRAGITFYRAPKEKLVEA